MNTLTQIAVPFHNAELYLVEHNGQPYVPMRPVVEGMGLTWASQTVKFNSNKARWGVSIIETPTLSGIQEMLCIPLRKLFGWFTSISPNKVKPELRDTVIMYQNECDDVLWDYWSKGQAINQRHTITPEQKSTLQEIVERKAGDQRALRAQIWTRHNRHFNINSYHELLTIHFDDAVRYLEEMEVKGKIEQTSFELLAADTTNKVMDYYWALHQEIKRLGGKVPDAPKFDEDTLVRATVTRMVQGSRMMLHMGYDNKPTIQLIPSDNWILSSDNIAQIIGDPSGPKKELLPEIIQAAAKRLTK
ncbi:phage antirepressor N-terminal domain-containing protein [Acinetobacter radioresistens]|uniref:phage antirepressor N-terminal domain-containing protein n=1 Tax=Acinetobacter radioresistens TaxID=40216 RepID=UPI0022475B40|nr:phage antirepressor N-terminal domain-containing protein [Acinetobacter radioresistens]MCX0334427.1 phage antirepressor protein [Acinetobacter radioresistens]